MLTGCNSGTACVTITVNPPLDLTLTPSTSICSGGTMDLYAEASGGNGGPYTFTWYDENGTGIAGTQIGDSSTINVNPSTPTWYYVELSDGCTISVLDSTQISLNPIPQALIAAVDSNGCAPFNAQFVANSDIGTTFEFDIDCDGIPEYSGPNNTFNYTYNQAGTYDVCLTVISPDGCDTTITSTQMITVYDLPIANFSTTPSETSILSPMIEMVDNSIGGINYDWNFGDGTTLSGHVDSVLSGDSLNTGYMVNPTHYYSDTGYFDIVLNISNDFGCTSSYTQTVYVEGDYILFTPSAFTPNNDGKNDVFIPKGLGIDPLNYEFYVFNRWGELIFTTTNPNQGWDGTYKGTMSQVDVYVWLVRTLDVKDVPHEYIGHVTLVK